MCSRPWIAACSSLTLGSTLTFTVVDIDAARAYLEGEGVRFDGETHQVEDMVKLCTFYDPDGNALMLAQQLR
jgi:predicted enzyme related to lactoylglutathione lyase